MDRRELVERAGRGDHDAFAVLATASAARLDATARLITGDYEELPWTEELPDWQRVVR